MVGSTRHGCGLHNVQQRANELKSRESNKAWVEEDSRFVARASDHDKGENPQTIGDCKSGFGKTAAKLPKKKKKKKQLEATEDVTKPRKKRLLGTQDRFGSSFSHNEKTFDTVVFLLLHGFIHSVSKLFTE